MDRLGGDVIRKIAAILEAQDRDKQVVLWAMTCKTLHHHLSANLARLRQMYSLGPFGPLHVYNSRKRMRWLVRSVQEKKTRFIEQSVQALLPSSDYWCEYDGDGLDICVGGWTFLCTCASIFVYSSDGFHSRIWPGRPGNSHPDYDWDGGDLLKSRLDPVLAVFMELRKYLKK
jgi:hypothetical protein